MHPYIWAAIITVGGGGMFSVIVALVNRGRKKRKEVEVPTPEPEEFELAKYFIALSETSKEFDDYSKAFEFQQEADKLFQAAGVKGITSLERANLLLQTGMNLVLLKKYPDAMNRTQEALSLFKQDGENEQFSRAFCYFVIAKIFRHEGAREKALECCKKSAQTFANLIPPDHEVFGFLYKEIGHVYAGDYKFTEAKMYFVMAYRNLGECLGYENSITRGIREFLEVIYDICCIAQSFDDWLAREMQYAKQVYDELLTEQKQQPQHKGEHT